jgi:hypothetical protein
MQKAQGKIARMYNELGQPLMISSRRDGEHSPGSFHYIGLAEDYLDNYATTKHISKKEIQGKLGSDFDVVEYSWGYHVEYDPKGR